MKHHETYRKGERECNKLVTVSLFIHMVYFASQLVQAKLMVEMAAHAMHMTSAGLTFHHVLLCNLEKENGNWCKAALTVVKIMTPIAQY
jgi:hypothetical protein